MKHLALSIPGYTISPPSGVAPTTNAVGFLGQNLFSVLFSILFVVAVILTIVFILLGAIQWITSGGDKEKVQKARGRLTYSIIGLFVVFLAFFAITFMGNLFGVNLFNFNIPFPSPPESGGSNSRPFPGGGGSGEFD